MKDETAKAIVDAVMELDLSRLLDEKFRPGDHLMGLSGVLQAKAKAKKEESDGDRIVRLWTRLEHYTEVKDLDGIEQAATRIREEWKK